MRIASQKINWIQKVDNSVIHKRENSWVTEVGDNLEREVGYYPGYRRGGITGIQK